jgi:hypothetical protein
MRGHRRPRVRGVGYHARDIEPEIEHAEEVVGGIGSEGFAQPAMAMRFGD